MYIVRTSLAVNEVFVDILDALHYSNNLLKKMQGIHNLTSKFYSIDLLLCKFSNANATKWSYMNMHSVTSGGILSNLFKTHFTF